MRLAFTTFRWFRMHPCRAVRYTSILIYFRECWFRNNIDCFWRKTRLFQHWVSVTWKRRGPRPKIHSSRRRYQKATPESRDAIARGGLGFRKNLGAISRDVEASILPRLPWTRIREENTRKSRSIDPKSFIFYFSLTSIFNTFEVNF